MELWDGSISFSKVVTKNVQDSMHFNASRPAALVRCHEVEQKARLGASFPARRPAMPHHAPNTQWWR